MNDRVPKPQHPDIDPCSDLPTRAEPRDRKGVMLRRQLNVVMLTTQRGTKNLLAALAATTSSRISLMTSGRKPVSDPFAHAIEEGLKLPRGWLDASHEISDVPPAVWAKLNVASVPTPICKPAAPPPANNAVDHAANVAAGPAMAQEVALLTKSSPTPSGSPYAGMQKNESVLFSKSSGLTGPIAEALAKTVLKLSAADKLPEKKAFQLLGLILEDLER